MPHHILLTGFDPFGGDVLNPSEAVARALDGERLAGWTVHGRVLPCVFDTARASLLQALDQIRPGVVLCLGLAGGRSGLSLERVAINLQDARIPDNVGAQPLQGPVVAGAPAAHFTRLPVKAIVAELTAAGLPASLSLSAGSFVCNHVFFSLMQALRRRSSVQAGFMHLPWLPEQVTGDGPPGSSLTLEDQVRGVRQSLLTTLAWRGRGDLSVAGGVES